MHPFTYEETTAYLAERGIATQERIDTIWRVSHGLPLYLGLLTSSTQGTVDSTKDVVDNFLNHIPANAPMKRRLALDAALFSKPFNQDDLEAFPYLSKQDRPVLYDWLLHQPFIQASSLPGRYMYHDLAQDLFQRHLFQSAPKTYDAIRRALAEYYQHELAHLQMVREKTIYQPSDEKVEVMLALAFQRFFLPDEESHIQALSPLLDILEYDDKAQVHSMLKMLRNTVEKLSLSQPGSHAHQVAQTLLDYIETRPWWNDHKHKQAWFQATDDLLKLIEHSSSHASELRVKMHCSCGWGYIGLGEYQLAHTSFHRALEIDPHSAIVYNGLGYTHYLLKDFGQALEYFTHGLQLAPRYPDPHLGRGRVYWRLKDYQQALPHIDHALQLDRRLWPAYHTRAHIYLELKTYRKALTEWDRVLEVAPGHPVTGAIKFCQGCAHLWLKDLLQAIICFTRSYELAPTEDHFLWAREWTMMCQAYPGLETRQHLEAIAQGDHYTAYVCRGVFLWLQKDFEQALTELQHAISFYDGDWSTTYWADRWQAWDVPFWRGMTYLALDLEEEARMAIEQALTLQMPPILLKPLCWFEQERPKLYEKLVKPLLATYDV
jgi:tetratricopeptide (TPR) repeat protein